MRLMHGTRSKVHKKWTVWTDPECKKLWEEFINDERFKVYFMTDQKIWKDKLQEVNDFIVRTKRTPNKRAKHAEQTEKEEQENAEEEKLLGRWLNQQKQSYKKNEGSVWDVPECKKLWEDFKSDPHFSKYFMTDHQEIWKDNLEKVKKIMLIFKRKGKRRRTKSENTEDERLRHWLSNQKKSYKKKESTVWNDPECKELWEEFINDERFKAYLMTDQENWKDTLEKVKKNMLKIKKRPSERAKAAEQAEQTEKTEKAQEKRLGKWVNRQNENYKKNERTVWKDPECKKLWEEFINDEQYAKYL